MALLERELDAESPPKWKITRDAYYALDRAGMFPPDMHTELIDGVIYKRISPIGAEHIYTANTLRKQIESMLVGRNSVVNDAAFILSDNSEPQPDIIVLRGPLKNYAHRKAASADIELVVEVSDSTIRFDRKAKLYAEANIPDYWIVNLAKRQVEVYRQPQESGTYASVQTFEESDSLTPLVMPNAVLPLADFLP